ncbi:TPA: glycosyltransferase family 2 protein [Vibrio vulnificus]|nr:glycosyltransferase family 2 protein [Vibrio vulnificus]HDY8136890.1 glycosyltransferase family 2 protein [Vibrio vulnificus]HDY8150413.1 glycosyltransferase family 2 protein [Vibrio vulnificus]HDY8153862.1 glycosyltransferase family 2 protein [Vibrio vulnificus]
MNNFDISIGLLSYKRTDLLKETINCLSNTKYKVELILLNNNDYCIRDEIESFLLGFSNITLNYIFLGKNIGVSQGRREIVEHCTSEYLIVLDDDIFIESFDLLVSSVLDTFYKDASLGAIAFNIAEYKTGLNNRYEIPHKNKKINLDSDFYTYLIIGAGNALKVEAVKRVGNFANDFGLYGFEEIDLAFRLIAEGYKIKYKSDCRILHKKSPDGRFSGDLVNQLYFENRTRMAKRYLKKRYFFSCLIIRFFYLLFKTKSFKLSYISLKVVLDDKVSHPFGSHFYKYIDEVDGFLWY